MHKDKIILTDNVKACRGFTHSYSTVMAKMLTLLAVLFVSASGISEDANNMSDQELVDYLNKKQHFFKAELPKMSYKQFKARLMDLKYMKIPEETVRAEKIVMNEDLPESFDAREKWPDCVSIKTIRDQANCESKGRDQRIISDYDILACCGSWCGDGCKGGYMLKAFEFVLLSGVVTGGSYKAKDCCKPYPFHPCGHHEGQPYYGECLKDNADTPPCRKLCQIRYKSEYPVDKIFGDSAEFVNASELAIQKEIFEKGPVQAGFIVYDDFQYYQKGVYVYTWGAEAGGHAVKIIGWGVENGVKYWLISNSWNSDWGEKGLFKIRRGTNECQIEEMVGTVTMDPK
ncbi:unnamed protein product [Cylicocyclus nassatus]|uniref:Peptidase C1A papain C-terminal domain-containing protein n=1 Tax=Cylicocyclus nassatus TaxID=53992 RepID=A0AA36DQZ5_CYLNA|nr:unnamed protein product [Cylicocyclus nassatus]